MKALLILVSIFNMTVFAAELGEKKALEECKFGNQAGRKAKEANEQPVKEKPKAEVQTVRA